MVGFCHSCCCRICSITQFRHGKVFQFFTLQWLPPRLLCCRQLTRIESRSTHVSIERRRRDSPLIVVISTIGLSSAAYHREWSWRRTDGFLLTSYYPEPHTTQSWPTISLPYNTAIRKKPQTDAKDWVIDKEYFQLSSIFFISIHDCFENHLMLHSLIASFSCFIGRAFIKIDYFTSTLI